MIELTSKPHICIKKTPHKKTLRRWFWNKKSGGITNSCGQKVAVNSMAKLKKYSFDCKDLSRNEVQIGDQVLYLYDKFYFGMIVDDTKSKYVILNNNGTIKNIYKRKGKTKKGRIILVDHNVGNHSNDRIRNNLVNAQIKSELDTAELICDLYARYYFVSIIPTLSMGEKLFKNIHKRLFGIIYRDSGEYRTHEVVIGARKYPTVSPENIAEEMSLFFKKLANPFLRQSSLSKEHLVKTLLLLHTELARIHPFEDGNGRTIRFFSELAALRWGYQIDWDITSRHNYHDAVKIAVNYGKQSKLKAIIWQGLTPLPHESA